MPLINNCHTFDHYVRVQKIITRTNKVYLHYSGSKRFLLVTVPCFKKKKKHEFFHSNVQTLQRSLSNLTTRNSICSFNPATRIKSRMTHSAFLHANGATFNCKYNATFVNSALLSVFLVRTPSTIPRHLK